jgi:uncharacterized membrane protein YwzB
MTLKAILYILVTIAAIWGLESINITNLFKKNRYYSSRVLYLLVSMALSYLVVNYLYDFFLNTKVI